MSWWQKFLMVISSAMRYVKYKLCTFTLSYVGLSDECIVACCLSAIMLHSACPRFIWLHIVLVEMVHTIL